MTPAAGVYVLGRCHISYIVKMHYFFKNLILSTPRHSSDKLSVYKGNNHGRVYRNCKFYDPQGWCSCARVGHISYRYIIKMHLFLSKFSSLVLGINQTN